MKAVPNEERTPLVPIDYIKLAEIYNGLEVGGAVDMDEKVYNITLFKKALSRRGVVSEVDFRAFNKNGKTLVKRLTLAVMTKE